MTTVRARYENGVFTPVEPLDLEEGKEVTLSVEEDAAAPELDGAAPPAHGQESLLEMFERLRGSVPAEEWDNLPADGAKNYKHYLYGHPKAED